MVRNPSGANPNNADAVVGDALAAPYVRILRKDDDGTYAAEVLEFSGCLGAGDTPNEAMADLEAAMDLWVRSEIRQGHDIPTPLDTRAYSGRVTLRIPPSVHERAALWASVEGLSLNRLLATAIAAYTGEAPRLTPIPTQDNSQPAYVAKRVAE